MADFVPVHIAYKEFTPANGTDESLSPVIFLHGMTASKEYWDDIPQVIADKTKRKAYAIDARNHGDSDHTDDFSFDTNVDDLFHFMDNMNIPKAVLVGHSMGSLTSTNAALRKPERVEMVFSEDMFVKKIPQHAIDPLVGFLKVWMQIVPTIPSNLNETEAKIFALDAMFSKIPPESPQFARKDDLYKLKYSFKRTPTGGYDLKYNKETILRGISNIDTIMSEPSGQYCGPAYFLYGDLSPIQVGKEEENIRTHFPKAELIEFKGATHNVHVEFPDKFKETILQYLQ